MWPRAAPWADGAKPPCCCFFRERFARDASYLARAEALRATGMTRDRASLPLLEEAGASASPHDVIRTAAQWARNDINRPGT